jgi:hypothetical protein
MFEDFDRVEIENLNTAWSCLETYCMIRTREGYYHRTSDIATMNEIFELNGTARSDISTIQAHVRNILNKVDKMTSMFKYYFAGEKTPYKIVFLKDILEYLQSHIAYQENSVTILSNEGGSSTSVGVLLRQLRECM